MNKRLLTLLVLGLTTATTACAITPAMQKKYERSGCTQMSELNGCDVNKSYQWNRDHGFIENSNGQQNRHHHGEKQQNTTNTDNHDNAGIDGKFSGITWPNLPMVNAALIFTSKIPAFTSMVMKCVT